MDIQMIGKKRFIVILALVALVLCYTGGCNQSSNRLYRVNDTAGLEGPYDRAYHSDEGPYNSDDYAETPQFSDDLNQISLANENNNVSTSHQVEYLPREYHVGTGDILQISVFQLLQPERESIFTTEIDPTGKIYLPVLNHVHVAGMTVPDIQQLLVSRLSRDFLRDPKVDVSIRQYVSKKIMLLGSIRQIGPMYLESDQIPLLDVICRAGGVGRDVAGTVEIIRGGYDSNKITGFQETSYTLQAQFPNGWNGEVVNLSRLFDGGNGRINPIIYPGDVIYVPPAQEGVFYVSGAVKAPGVKSFRRPMNFLKAVTAAGGAKWIAKENKCKLVRTMEDGTEEVVVVDLEKIRKGQATDNVILAQNDMIIIPTDPVKKFFDDLNNLVKRGVNTAVTVTYDAAPDMGIGDSGGGVQ